MLHRRKRIQPVMEKTYLAVSQHYEQANQSECLALRTFKYLKHHLDLADSNKSPESRRI